jgi:hypothetical protein
MAKRKYVRKHYFVDTKTQGALVFRIVLYWAVLMFDIAATFLFWRLVTSPIHDFNPYWDTTWFEFGPALLTSLLLLPAAIVDIIRFTNRFVGPILRLRRSMRALARGEHVEPIKFRRGDFWQEFADEFNAVLARMQQLQQPTSAAAAQPAPQPETEMAVVA